MHDAHDIASSASRSPESAGPSACGVPLVRMGKRDDVESLYRLACSGGEGLTNLPPDREALASKLAASEMALESAGTRAAGASIIMMVEMDGRIVGTSCVFPHVGAEWPFYSYRLTRQVSRSLTLGKRNAQNLLNLVNDFDGECEVGGLFVDPECRGHAVGKLAARARYLFIASHREWFGAKVIAELRGYQDTSGRSPVWEAIGRFFYDMDFSVADRTGALAGNQFIADLGPRYPLYISMLPEPARAALGRPHDDGRPAYQMLLDEGFSAGEYIDIFDGGPTLVADIDRVRSVRSCREAKVTDIDHNDDWAANALVSCGHGMNFRVVRGFVTSEDKIDTKTASILDLQIGDKFRHVPI